MRLPVLLFINCLCFSISSFAQLATVPGKVLFKNAKVISSDSGNFISVLRPVGCRGFIQQHFEMPEDAISNEVIQARPEILKEPFIQIHGNVTYNFNYRSYLDTPFAEHDLMQHAVQTRFNLNIRNRYPLTVFLTSRRSNSPFFRNAADVSFQFRQADMLEDMKQKLRAGADSLLKDPSLVLTPAQMYLKEQAGLLKNAGTLPSGLEDAAFRYAKEKSSGAAEKFKKLYDEYKAKAASLAALQKQMKHSSWEQELIEEKERKIRGVTESAKEAAREELTSFIRKSSAKVDSSVSGVKSRIDEKKEEIAKLRKETAQAEKEIRLFQKKITDSLQQVKKQVAAIRNKDGLYTYLQDKGKSVKEIPAFQRALLSIKQIGIGRTWLDYSELTVKNISLSGFNIEANPGKLYVAAAAGKVNYRFRDYIVKGDYAGSGQSIGLLRAGFGTKEGNNFIVTYYTGQKALLNQRTSADAASVQRISGFSVETKAALDANNFLVAEYARSVSRGIPGKLLDLKSHTNEAVSVKLFSHYGNTKITGFYRKTGESFQSFTLFPTNTKQDAWMVRANQGIWKNRILVDAAIRKNDFNSPIALPDYSNQNVFKSFQVTARIPKYPFFSAGYYPSSQLTLSNNNLLYENRYNTLNTIISHSYSVKQLRMNSNATYTKFYNSGSDSGFIYFNAATLTVNHSVNLRSFVLEGNIALTDQSLLHIVTMEPAVTYRVKDKFSVSAGAKRTRLNHTETLWGGSAGLNLYLQKLGTIQMHYDKIFLPGYNRNLIPVDIGRMTFSREF